MKFLGENMMYLGNEIRESKKSGNQYMLVKLMDQEDQHIYEMFVGNHSLQLQKDVHQLTPFTPVNAGFKMSSFNNKAQVDLVAIQPVEGKK